KVKSLIAGGKVTSSRCGEPGLSVHPYTGAEAVAIAARAAQWDHQPVLLAAAIKKNLWRSAERSHHHVLPSIVVEVAKSGSASGCWRGTPRVKALKARVSIHGQQGKLPIVKRRINLLDVVENVTLRHEEIL